MFVVIAFMSITLHAEKLGYALSGGGARGFAHIGVLKVLEEEGIRPDYLAGSSIGAIIGALYAMGYSAAEIEQICLSINWDYLALDVHSRKELYIGQKRWSPYGNAIFEVNDTWVPRLPSSVYVGNKINLELFKMFAPASQVASFTKLPIPFACNATNLITGEAVTFDSGSLMQALRASMSIPSLVQPFSINGDVYIDGGVSQNLPGELLHDLGADKVIGIKVNSTLRNRDNLNNLIEVLDQTINIGITRNLNEHLDLFDFIIEPNLSSFSATDFQKIKEIIDTGERSTREQISSLRQFKEQINQSASENSSMGFNKKLSLYNITRVDVRGNRFLSQAKIQEYTKLFAGNMYHVNDIYDGCQKAWNSQAFNTIYPVLERIEGNSYKLIIHVQERERRQLGINLSYNSEDKLSAGAVLSLNNCLLKNSKLITEVKLGGRNELNIDYVKNYGEEWGAYYRLFPYINEKTQYTYKDHHKTNSVRSLEWGMTSGLGLFAKDFAIAELFLYSSRTKMYEKISEAPSLPLESTVSGFGVKLYNESLDDYYFPTKGTRVLNKFNFSRNTTVSDDIYSCMQLKAELYVPIGDLLSIGNTLDYGTYFGSDNDMKYNPFIIGGADGFMGYSRYELSAPYYQMITSGISINPYANWVLELGAQALRYSEHELWQDDNNWEFCGFGGIGYRSKLMPIRIKLAINEAGKLNSLLSVGYDTDIFKFSRK